jgi:hypothetical protein
MHVRPGVSANGNLSERNQQYFYQSSYLRRHPLNLRHVVVLNRIGLTIIPSNGDPAPCGPYHGAEIGGATFPANPVAYFEKSGLIAGHSGAKRSRKQALISYELDVASRHREKMNSSTP